jgi:hypothetical protein
MDLIYLPAYENYDDYWINLALVESIKYDSAQRTIAITFNSGRKKVITGLWVDVLVDVLPYGSLTDKDFVPTKLNDALEED